MTITKFYIICGFHEAGLHGIVVIEVFYMKIGFISLGCSKNLVDSEKMMGMINSGGHELVHNADEAEAIIINTC